MGLVVLVSGLYAAASLVLGLRRKRRLERLLREAERESEDAQQREALQAGASDQSTNILPALLTRPRTPRRHGE